MAEHTRRPRDRSDLYLAPVALALDERLDEMATLSQAELERRVALEANVDLARPGVREDGLVTSIAHLIELHGWTVSLVPRGVRVAHDDHALVLGLPDNCRQFLG
jgi:hypothetical protein